MRRILLIRLAAALPALALLAGQPVWANGAPVPIETARFGTVFQGTLVEHEFAIDNPTGQPLRVAGVDLSPRLTVDRLPATLAPNSVSRLRLRVGTTSLKGPFEGRVVVRFESDTVASREYRIEGEIRPPIEVLPMPAFFVSTMRGQARTAVLEIVNHEADPVELSLPAQAPGLPAMLLEPLEAGRRHRLTLSVPDTAAAGRLQYFVDLASSSRLKPLLRIGVNVIVRERVFTFPDQVDMGRVPLAAARSVAGPSSGLVQTLMVYQPDGKAFAVRASTDVPGLDLRVEAGPAGDRAQITLFFDPERIRPGRLNGVIRLETNDSQFGHLEVPVRGEVLPD